MKNTSGKNYRKFLAWILSAAVFLAPAPGAFAAQTGQEETTEKDTVQENVFRGEEESTGDSGDEKTQDEDSRTENPDQEKSDGMDLEGQDPKGSDEEDQELEEYIRQAREALARVTGQESVMALVYLCDKYPVKKTADSESAAVVNLPSGSTVVLEGVDFDGDYNIWYRVSAEYQGTVYSGFIERTYLAYSNERFLEWEDTYFPNMVMFSAEIGGYPDVEQFPASYQDRLMRLKQAHPNWIFVRQNTNLEWKKVVSEECYRDRNLISESQGAAWRGEKYGQGWYYASEGAVKYYLDPRNFLDDTRVFQFEQLTYNPSYHSSKAVQNILSNTFMKGSLPGAGMTYAEAFFQIGVSLKVSPFHLACRVYQEQGKGTSPLISGTYDAVPKYKGYYNYFNISAHGTTDKQVVESGLAKACEQGWNTPYKSLMGGAEIVSRNYIRRGQDTLYLQKFDVDASDGTLYTHQYMQNVMAPWSESSMVKKAYGNTGALENPFVFKIPVYNNMPELPCPTPTATPSVKPTSSPSPSATATPGVKPTVSPSPSATAGTGERPTVSPSPSATAGTGERPTASPSPTATATPGGKPTSSARPVESATPEKTAGPGSEATTSPGTKPTSSPGPAATGSSRPDSRPTDAVNTTPAVKPTATIRPQTTATPQGTPGASPSATPAATATPGVKPTAATTATPSAIATATPQASPAVTATATPRVSPTATAATTPGASPTAVASVAPSVVPSAAPGSGGSGGVKPGATDKPQTGQGETPSTDANGDQGSNAAVQTPASNAGAVQTPSPAAPSSSESGEPGDGSNTGGGGNADTATGAAAGSSGVTVSAATPRPHTAAEEKDIVTMDMSRTDMVYAQTLQQIKEQGMEVILNMSGDVSWTIDGSAMEGDSFEDINLKVSLGESGIPRDRLEIFAGEERYMEMSLAHEGEFGFDMLLTVTLEEAEPDEYASLFYYNGETGAFEFMCAAPVSSTGKAAFTFSHASDYVIIISGETKEGLPAQRAQALQEAGEREREALAQAREELPAEEPKKAAGIIALILLGSAAIGIGGYLIIRRKSER